MGNEGIIMKSPFENIQLLPVSRIMLVFILIYLLSLVGLAWCHVIISEVNLGAGGGVNDFPFVELLNTANESYSITNFSLVLFNSSVAISLIRLPRVVLSPGGYYVIGSLPPQGSRVNGSSINGSAIDQGWSGDGLSDVDNGAVALYDGENANVGVGMEPTAQFLDDAIIFSKVTPSDASMLAPELDQEIVVVQDQLYLPKRALSINRCPERDRNVYGFASPSPKQRNLCESVVVPSPVVINEVNALNPGEDTMEYIELYNKANMSVSLNNYVLILYNGASNKAYRVIPLTNASIEALGYYLIGSQNVEPTPQTLLGNRFVLNILQNGIAAVALYKGNVSVSQGSNATDRLLIDAVVYDKRGRHAQDLIDILTPGEDTVHEDHSYIAGLDESIGRCEGNDRFNTSQFRLTHLTPATENDCSVIDPSPTIPNFPPIDPEALPYIVINEFRVTDSESFIELFDGGLGRVPLDSVLLVFYSGSSLSVYTEPVSLQGHFTNQNGYFLIGGQELRPRPDLVLETLPEVDGCNAIALHLLELTTTIEDGSPVSRTSLIDVVLYGEPRTPQDQDLIDILAPGQVYLRSDNDDQSWSRCRGWDRFMQGSFTLGPATPDTLNSCPLPPIVINEVNIDPSNDSNQFIELYDGGAGSQTLDGLVLVLYSGESSQSYRAIDLTGYSTDEAGFLVLGPENGTNVDLVVYATDGIFLKGGPDAIALHVGPAKYFRSRQASSTNLVDAVVYGTDDVPDLALLHKLLPNQHHLNEIPHDPSSSVDKSISRCYCCTQRNQSAFGGAPSSPGAINVDCSRNNETFTETVAMYQRLLRISEVKYDSSDRSGGGFLEIYDGGLGGVDLDNILLDLLTMNSADESRYLRFNLSGHQTNSEGYFVINSPSPDVAPTIVVNRTSVSLSEDSVDHSMPLMQQSDAGNVQLSSETLNKVIDTVTFGLAGTEDWMLLGSLDIGLSLVTINDPVMNGVDSIQRCYSPKPKEQLAFAVSTPTKGMDNSCPLPPVVINELNPDSPIIDLGEYVELSSLGVPHFPINNITLASINGETGQVHRSLTLNGYQTDSNGLLLIGYRALSVPRPDVPQFPQPVGWIRDGPDSVAIFRGNRQMYGEGTTPREEYMIDEVEYDASNSSAEDRDASISRCHHANGSVTYERTNVSPKALNLCPLRADVTILINEVSLVTGEQFVEIWDLGNGFSVLDGIVLVLFGDGDQSYSTFSLTGHHTNQAGYFVIGESGVVPSPHYVVDGFIRPNYGAVALFRISGSGSLDPGDHPSTEGLLDAIVYSDWTNGSATGLSRALVPNSLPVPADMLHTKSLSRCFSTDTLLMSPFLIGRTQTPDNLNDCPAFVTDVVINEINVDIPGMDTTEYIELYDGGRGNVSLDFTTLVLFNGAGSEDLSYLSLGLDGYRTDSRGYFLIGSHLFGERADLMIHSAPRGFLQNGPDAVALYRAHVGAFPFGTTVTGTSLIDALVYAINDKKDWRMVNELVPGYFTIKEDRAHLARDESLSRCHGLHRRDPTAFALTHPTPGRQNNCTASVDFDSAVIISELNVIDDPFNPVGQYVEIYDHGVGHTLLNDLLLVFFDGSNDRSYFEVDLSNRVTHADGYYLIGTGDVSPRPDLVIPQGVIQGGSDAVVLYRVPSNSGSESFPRGSGVSTDDIQDAVVYGSSMASDASLMTTLALGQMQVMEVAGSRVGGDRSIGGGGSRGALSASRCLSNQSVAMSAFISAIPSPGTPNNCMLPPVIINELNLENQAVGSREFIELFDGGQGSTPLDSLIVVLFAGVNGGRAYKTIPLQGHRTDENGFFLIGTSQSSTYLDISVGNLGHSFLRNGANAVALYRGDHRDYQPGMPATSLGLVDALVFGTVDHRSIMLVNELLPGQDQVTEDARFQVGDAGLSRCESQRPLQSTAFKLAHPSPRQPNLCSPEAGTPSPPQLVVINEVNPFDVATGGKEFIELKGPPSASLDDHVIVIVMENTNVATVSHVVDLSGKRLDPGGFFLIGAATVSPLPTVLFPERANGTLEATGGAVTIFRGQPEEFMVGSSVRVNRIVDAVVYSNAAQASMLGALTTTGKTFMDDASVLPGDETISRCSCCELRSTFVFMLTTPTPGSENACPGHQYGRKIQLRLLDMVYGVYRGNSDRMMTAIRDVIVDGVKKECACRFNALYLQDERLLNGSVIYQAVLLALSPTQASRLWDAYTSFVGRTKSVTILGKEYLVDGTCVADCSSKAEYRKTVLVHPGPAMIVGVTVAVVLVIGFAAAILFYFKRKRPISFKMGTMRYFKEEIDLDGEFRVTNACQLNDLDVLARETDDNFVNPYFGVPPTVLETRETAILDNGNKNSPVSVDLEVDTSISHA